MNARLNGESYEAYRERRKAAHKAEKEHLRGRRVKYTKKEIDARIKAFLPQTPSSGGQAVPIRVRVPVEGDK